GRHPGLRGIPLRRRRLKMYSPEDPDCGAKILKLPHGARRYKDWSDNTSSAGGAPMRKIKPVLALGLVLAMLPVIGCQKKAINFSQELPPGQMALRKISPGEYPDFSVNDTDAAALA